MKLRRAVVVPLVGVGAYCWWSSRRNQPRAIETTGGPIVLQPADVAPFAAPATDAASDTAAAPATALWVPPVDEKCPPGYPVKANDNSGIYHVPGGRFYDRTIPERCYASAEDAQADGYRRSKA